MQTRIASSATPVVRRAFSRFTPWICTSCQARSGRNRYLSIQTSKPSSPITSTKPYYITTPIFYVNAAPHVGHLYTMVLSDIIKRWQVLTGNTAILCTGTDEHGLKVQKAAAKAGADPKLFCDKGADIFKCSIETGSEVEWSSETNYHFRLSAFRDKLLAFYAANPTWITPEYRMKEVVQAVTEGLDDLSISRPYDRLSWGIQVPGDDTQTIYVWLDALVNYITKAGYPWSPGRETAGGWPADCHVIGKDIVRFHCIYWPAILMALDLPLPKKILSHAHWTLGGSKMSKSTGRVVDPFHAIDRFGADVMRFYMGHEGGIRNDSSYDNVRIVELYNKFLGNKLGNLASRVLRNKKWSVRGAVERVGGRSAHEWDEGPGARFWQNSLCTIAPRVNAAFQVYEPRDAVRHLADFVRGANDFFQMSSPWDKILNFGPREPGEDVDKIIFEAAEALRISGILLLPWMPNKASVLLDQLGRGFIVANYVLIILLLDAAATMAFNNWDKLSKAQRDYPKSKYAIAVVDKALKKQPSNPFLMAWPSDKKQSHFALIIATQISAEQKRAQAGPQDRMAQLQADIALKLMKQAYMAPSDDLIAVKNIRDLRFMADIFNRQNRCHELIDLWENPPESVKDILHRHRQDLSSLITRLLRERKDWFRLERHCLNTIDETLSNLSVVTHSKSRFWELCAWRWDLWTALLDAVHAIRPGQEGEKIISDRMKRCFGTEFEAKDRALQITYMKLHQQLTAPMLSDCKDYFLDHAHIPSCFEDLRPFVERLDFDQVRELSYLWPLNPDFGCITIYALLQLHHGYSCMSEAVSPLEGAANSRLLLQASMYARHLVENDKEKQNRTLSLLTARLHLNIGLGTVAFRIYNHTKCKEMLMDTLSPHILSRISQTHPFDVKGYGGFSADEELAKVISTIERMETKTNNYLFTDMPSFVWDQVVDTLALKRRLNSSLTKHICYAERVRIARLKGEPVANIPRLDYKTYSNISDNIDREIFPNSDVSSRPERLLDLIMPSGIPNHIWITQTHLHREKPNQILYRESINNFDPVISQKIGTDITINLNGYTRAERRVDVYWLKIVALVEEVHSPTCSPKISLKLFDELLIEIDDLRLGLEKLCLSDVTTFKLENGPTMFHENMLMACYSQLEVLRAAYRLAELIRDRILKPKGRDQHALKKVLSDKYDNKLLDKTTVCFQAVHDVAQSYISLIKIKGVKAIIAQVRWGITGDALRVHLSDENLEYYAKEYVESALEAWMGVLKVKLK
ncbi:hypothetical protein GQ44DRAFT_735904 [Phaeosphaeriaceae sp. PMI808]|nr:hypothetical protein GQ44DRAFT_735904 [Phaeosphaeriaceae sp. PMI808]